MDRFKDSIASNLLTAAGRLTISLGSCSILSFFSITLDFRDTRLPFVSKSLSSPFLRSTTYVYHGKCRWVATGKYLLNFARRPKALERPILTPWTRLGAQNIRRKKVCLLNIAIILIPSRLSQETFKLQKKQDQQFSRHHLLSRHFHPLQPCLAKYSASSSMSRTPSPSSSNPPSSSSWPSVS